MSNYVKQTKVDEIGFWQSMRDLFNFGLRYIPAIVLLVYFSHHFQEAVKKSNSIEVRANSYIEQAARNSWMLVTPAQKGDGVYTSSKIDNYLKWLNSKSGKNFSKEQDLRVKTVNLAQNINRVGETAFCI